MRNYWLYPSERLGHTLGLMIFGTRWIELQMAECTILQFCVEILSYRYPELFVNPISSDRLARNLSFLQEPIEELIEPKQVTSHNLNFSPPKECDISDEELSEIQSYLVVKMMIEVTIRWWS